MVLQEKAPYSPTQLVVLSIEPALAGPIANDKSNASAIAIVALLNIGGSMKMVRIGRKKRKAQIWWMPSAITDHCGTVRGSRIIVFANFRTVMGFPRRYP